MDKQTDQARELIVQQRQQDDLRQDAMLVRSEEELHEVDASTVEQRARTAMASQLKEEEQTEEALLERSVEELHQP